MKMKKNYTVSSGGYAGIIMLLITFLIIAFLLVRPDILSGNHSTQSTLERGVKAVDQAKDARNMIEVQSQADVDMQNELLK